MQNRQSRNDEERSYTVSEILRAMEAPSYPDFVPAVAREVQEWMASILASEEAYYAGEGEPEEAPGDVEALYQRLAWVESFADLLPGPSVQGFGDAIVVSVWAPEPDEGLRLAVDHAALFARGSCHRVWLFCDTWIIGDAMRYQQHVRTLTAQGIEFHFLLVTPWGWTEIPLGKAADGSRAFPWRNDRRGGNSQKRRKGKEEHGE